MVKLSWFWKLGTKSWYNEVNNFFANFMMVFLFNEFSSPSGGLFHLKDSIMKIFRIPSVKKKVFRIRLRIRKFISTLTSWKDSYIFFHHVVRLNIMYISYDSIVVLHVLGPVSFKYNPAHNWYACEISCAAIRAKYLIYIHRRRQMHPWSIHSTFSFGVWPSNLLLCANNGVATRLM